MILRCIVGGCNDVGLHTPYYHHPLCATHTALEQAIWIKGERMTILDIVGKIAASMAIGFAGKSFEDITKLSLDLAEMLVIENKRRTS